jgi:hypothetical protein
MESDAILLVQVEQSSQSRTFYYHMSLDQAINEVLNVYERRLKILNPDIRELSYSLKDVNSFIDRCPEFGILVFDGRLQAFVPHDKAWIKDRVARKLVR